MKRGDAWVGLVALGTAVEVISLRQSRHDATLSHATRVWFRTDTRSGRIAFCAFWVGIALWFPRHILKGSNESH